MAIELDIRWLSVADYQQMGKYGILPEKGIELIHGKIINMSPSGEGHAGFVKQLIFLIGPLIAGKAIISVQDPINLDEHTQPEPDLAILKPKKTFYKDAHPSPHDIFCIIEVSDSSLTYDRDIKGPLYAQAGIPEFLLLDVNAQQLELYSQPQSGQYRLKELIMPDGLIQLKSLGVELEAKKVFEG